MQLFVILGAQSGNTYLLVTAIALISQSHVDLLHSK